MKLPAQFPKHRVAHVLKRYPWLGYMAQWGYRRFQERLSCGVIGVITDSRDRILIVEHVFHPHHPWGLPGGWMDRGEAPERTIIREAFEETGLEVRPVRPLLIVRSSFLAAHLDVAYLCTFKGNPDSVRLTEELLDYRWITFDQALGLRTTDFHMAALREAVKDSTLLSRNR